jgi:hypothetical protein
MRLYVQSALFEQAKEHVGRKKESRSMACQGTEPSI